HHQLLTLSLTPLFRSLEAESDVVNLAGDEDTGVREADLAFDACLDGSGEDFAVRKVLPSLGADPGPALGDEPQVCALGDDPQLPDRKSTRLNSSHVSL